MVTKIFVYLAILLLPLGQIGKFTLGSPLINLYIWDIFLTLAVLSWLVAYWRQLVNLIRCQPVVRAGAIFGLVATVATLASLRLFNLGEVGVGSLYLWRWLGYFLLTPLVTVEFKKEDKPKLFLVTVFSGLLLAAGGWIQLWIIPDLNSLVKFGWDPHQSRLVSTLLDPNFTGALLVLTLIYLTAYLLDHRQKRGWGLIILAFLYLSLVYTFSRSAYLMFLVSFLAIGYLRTWKVALVAVLVFLISLQTQPRVEQRVSGAVQVDASAEHRLTSWQKAKLIFKSHPILGVGFNNYRFAQLKYRLIQDGPVPGGHAGAGTDSSFLFILVTTGLAGGLAWAGFLFRILTDLVGRAKNDWLALASLTSFFGIIFHAQFVNSLFYPPIMIYLFVGLGLALKVKS